MDTAKERLKRNERGKDVKEERRQKDLGKRG